MVEKKFIVKIKQTTGKPTDLTPERIKYLLLKALDTEVTITYNVLVEETK
jgi:hypothetical protein